MIKYQFSSVEHKSLKQSTKSGDGYSASVIFPPHTWMSILLNTRRNTHTRKGHSSLSDLGRLFLPES